MRNTVFILSSIVFFIIGCGNQAGNIDANESDEVLTPVTVATGRNEFIRDSIKLNATSSYLLSADIKANINGYINSANLHLGDVVHKGETLFTLQTKESKSIENTINKLDSTFKFSGISHVRSAVNGYITMLNHQLGDYVQDGEILATITDKNSFGFTLSLPFEYRRLIQMNQSIDIALPDGTKTTGQVFRIMPQMDSISQSQQIFIKTMAGNLPAGLIAKVILTKQSINAFTLPKACVYADDSQQNFWVMKLLNDSEAVKITVTKTLENDTNIAIASPAFNPHDRFVMQGGYGLADTARITIEK